MVLVNEKYFDGYLKSFMDQLSKAVEQKWDGLFYFGGMEGAGKTTFALQVASYLDPNFNIENVVFDGESFVSACIKAKPKTAIVFDESYNVFNNRNHANKLTNKVISMLTMIRSKQLFILIVSPTFFDLSKYLIVHRSRAFINVYAKDMKRGFFSFYNYEKKAELYHRGKREHNMNVVKPLFWGRFTNWTPLDMCAYEERKQKAISALANNNEKEKKVLSDEALIGARLEAESRILKFLKNNQLLKFGALSRVAESYYEIGSGALTKRLDKIKI